MNAPTFAKAEIIRAALLSLIVWALAISAANTQEKTTSATPAVIRELLASVTADRSYAETRRLRAQEMRTLAADALVSAQSGNAADRQSWLDRAREWESNAAAIDAEVARLEERAAEKEVRAALLRAGDPEGTVPVKPKDTVTATVTGDGTTKAEATITKISPYMKRCEENGVPLPPKWGSVWQKRGQVDPASVFAGIQPVTELWAYTNELGACFALPRMLGSGEIEALGIVCQGTASGKACFWDNLRPDGTKIMGLATVGMDPADIQDGDSLTQICTNCHRGENAFFVHPDTVLKQPEMALAKDRRYEPISTKSSWSNEPGNLGSAIELCEGCHKLPKLTKEYCQMTKALVGKTMPEVGDWWSNDFSDSVEALAGECTALGETWIPQLENIPEGLSPTSFAILRAPPSRGAAWDIRQEAALESTDLLEFVKETEKLLQAFPGLRANDEEKKQFKTGLDQLLQNA